MATWRSEVLPWIAIVGVIGAGAILSQKASEEEQVTDRQNYYVSRAECESDYSPEQCHTSGGYYYGPHYYGRYATANDPGPGRTALNGGDSQTARGVVDGVGTTRGGFGETARGSSSGRGGHG